MNNQIIVHIQFCFCEATTFIYQHIFKYRVTEILNTSTSIKGVEAYLKQLSNVDFNKYQVEHFRPNAQ